MSSIYKLFCLLLVVPPQKGSAIIWLQGDRYDRGSKVLQLYNNGWSKKIVLTGNDVLLSSTSRPGEKNISLQSMRDWLIKNDVNEKHISIDSQSFNTKEQAQSIIMLAKKNKWSKILLVGSSYYQPRAFLTFLGISEKLHWDGLIINQPFFVEQNKIPGGRDVSVRKLFLKEIKKIGLYKNEISTVRKGIEYIKDNFIRVQLSPATRRDAEFLFELRNDSVTRNNSFSQKEVTMSEHVTWLVNVLSNKKVFLYVILNEHNERIGQVRFEIVNKHAKISISICAAFRGRGYGMETISSSSLMFLSKIPTLKKIVAEVKKENVISIASFVKSGYVLTKKSKGIVTLSFNNL